MSGVGTWIQNVGAAWLMTSLAASSPLLVALVQTATNLPMLLFSLPAGALGDLVDRRRVLLVTQTWMLLSAAALAALAYTGHVTPWVLLALTFVLGVGNTLNRPAEQAAVTELVPREELTQAVTLNGASVNASRAVGPALGGLMVAVFGVPAAFLANAASYLGFLAAVYHWRRLADARQDPRDHMVAAMRAGLRYARHTPPLVAVLVRTCAFVACGSSVWALAPVLARRDLGMDATGYGVLLSFLGVGAVLGTVVLPGVRRRLPVDYLVLASTALFALATAVLAEVRLLPVLWLAMVAGGFAWMALLTGFNALAQLTAPAWMQGRTVAVFILVNLGSQSLSSALWGAVAGRVGEVGTLLASAASLVVVGAAVLPFWRLEGVGAQDMSAAAAHAAARGVGFTPQPGEGPVLVQLEYRVPARDGAAFAAAMTAVGQVRRRDGAHRWEVRRDVADPERYVESFLVASWPAYLRQIERVTVTDRAVFDRAFAFHVGGEPPRVSHFVGRGERG